DTPEEILLAIEDISERHDAITVLTDADRRKNQFIAMLSHELRNPLAPIRNALQLIRLDRNENPAQRRAREIIERQLAQLTSLLTGLLEISRVSAGTITLNPERIELKDLVARAVEASRPVIDQRNPQPRF
ncbi:MAG: sensor histidine kinase, partial [Candidatus Binataceae bacterium]